MVQLRSQPATPLADRLKLSTWGGPEPSERTMLLLRKYDLAGPYHRSPHKQLPEVWKIYEEQPTEEACYAISELSFIAAKRKEQSAPERAQAMFWHATLLSYTYLFDPQFNRDRNPYDPQFRGACELYNSSLEGLLRLAQTHGLFQPGSQIPIPNGAHLSNLPVVNMDFEWQNEQSGRFEFVSNYELNGLKNQYKTHGLGVPLIAVRGSRNSLTTAENKSGTGPSFPVTAFLRFDRFPRKYSDTADGQVELYDPLNNTEIRVANRTVILESDISTPLAFFLGDEQLNNLDNMGLFRPDKAESLAGIYMVQPYQPDKIPVLMIHGLWSSPMTWMEAFNDLRSSEEIREKYQFWFYLYPTGKSFWESAADLRVHLAQVEKQYSSPGQKDPLQDMVLVGHSMGGLIAKLQTLDSGDQIWGTLSRIPFDKVDANTATREHIQRTYFFEKNPQVTRVITIGSPHRGSNYSNFTTQTLLRPFIVLPQNTIKSAARLLLKNPGIQRDSAPLLVSTGVDSLDPKSPILQVLAEAPLPESVHFHNVVGAVRKETPLEKNTDGVVAYASAHLDNILSELVVPAGHSQVHRHPKTVLEIHRILLDHLKDISAQSPSGVIQLGDERLKAKKESNAPPEKEVMTGHYGPMGNAEEWFTDSEEISETYFTGIGQVNHENSTDEEIDEEWEPGWQTVPE